MLVGGYTSSIWELVERNWIVKDWWYCSSTLHEMTTFREMDSTTLAKVLDTISICVFYAFQSIDLLCNHGIFAIVKIFILASVINWFGVFSLGLHHITFS